MRLVRLTLLFPLILIAMISCFGEGGDQDQAFLRVTFPPTAACLSNQKLIQFRNISDQELVIEGAAISAGTNAEGNFSLQALRVGTQEVPALSGFLNDVHIPAGASYSFLVSYAPISEQSRHTALLDIAYRAPKPGVTQVAMEGVSGDTDPSCAPECQQNSDCLNGQFCNSSQECEANPTGQTTSGNTTSGNTTSGNTTSGNTTSGGTGGPGDLQGNMSITINRIALVCSALAQAVTTDPAETEPDYEPVSVPVNFNASSDSVILPLIPSSALFDLPPSIVPPLSNNIRSFTHVTTLADAPGTYGSDGSITIQNVPIRLNECFQADFTVTLTTGEAQGTPTIDLGQVREICDRDPVTNTRKINGCRALAGTPWRIRGSPIHPTTFGMTLVGVAEFDNAVAITQPCDVVGSLEGTQGAVFIEAVVNRP